MNEAMLSQLYLKDTAFRELMQERIYNVLLIASKYDAFVLEEDGRVEEQIFMEYTSLSLSAPPRVTIVHDYADARQELADKHYDLIITIPGVDVAQNLVDATQIKHNHPNVPIVLLTAFSRQVSQRLVGLDFSGVDYVFSWLGNVDLLVAIIKLLEDKMNAPHDVLDVGVQMILFVEDSIRFYSSLLPVLYKFILNQSRRFSTEALNAHESMLRMRGRPKVMLARDYEEALALYDTYHEHILGVISDVSFKRNGTKDSLAGIRLAHELRQADPYLPIIIESTEADNRSRVKTFGGVFLDKTSKKLPVDLGKAVMENFGFGDFVFRDPDTKRELVRIPDLKALQNILFDVPAESLFYHARRNDISRWLYSRALFPVAEVVKMHRFNSIEEAPAVRQLFFDLIVKYRKMKNRGVVAEFRADRYDLYSNFARIGQGSLGGKGRGLAFIDSIIKQHPECDNLDGATLRIPHTVVLCTDVFDEFMELNGLYPLALSDAPDRQILDAFLAARLPEWLNDAFTTICDVFDGPLAVRSSSLLEDSHYQPFAGIYATYMVPRGEHTATLLRNAVKGVYASVFYAQSKAYMVATSNVIDQEKMAVIIQEVVGQPHGNHFFPSFSGVGRSVNYYPTGHEQADDGVAELAVGLGCHIVGGGKSLRFSPRHPKHVLQTGTIELALRSTQTHLSALRTDNDNSPELNEGYNIDRLDVQQAADNGMLHYLVSTYDRDNDRLLDTDQARGRKVVTFANILRDGVFPLAKAIDFMLNVGREQMGRPVEIEFAGNLAQTPNDNDRGTLYWLQIRPMVDRTEMTADNIDTAEPQQLIFRSTHALGHGNTDNLHTLVMVRNEAFSLANNPDIAAEVARINRQLTDRGQRYILVGPGRWGSSDPALGIPVAWADIANAALIVELSLPTLRIEPSQGSHFFQNLTSFGVGYFAVGQPGDGSFVDTEFLDHWPQRQQTPYLNILHFDNPIAVAINGRQGLGVVYKPEKSNP